MTVINDLHLDPDPGEVDTRESDQALRCYVSDDALYTSRESEVVFVRHRYSMCSADIALVPLANRSVLRSVG